MKTRSRINAAVRMLLVVGAAGVLWGCGEAAETSTRSTRPSVPPSATTAKDAPASGGVAHRLDDGRRPRFIEPPSPGEPGAADADSLLCRSRDREIAAEELVDKSLSAARRILEGTGCSLRVVARDGASPAVTDDYVPSRINVALRGGLIVRVVGFF